MKCDQDLCLKLCYDLKKLLWQDELNPRVLWQCLLWGRPLMTWDAPKMVHFEPNCQTWQACKRSKVVQKGPKWSFWPFGEKKRIPCVRDKKV